MQSTTLAGATQQFAGVPAHNSSIHASASNALAIRDHNTQARSQVAKHRAIAFARGQSDGGQQLCAIREDANESQLARLEELNGCVQQFGTQAAAFRQQNALMQV